MEYPIVKQVPNGSIYLHECELYIQEGCVKGWGYQMSYGRNILADKYQTPTGKIVIIEKRVLSVITESEARESLKEAGY